MFFNWKLYLEVYSLKANIQRSGKQRERLFPTTWLCDPENQARDTTAVQSEQHPLTYWEGVPPWFSVAIGTRRAAPWLITQQGLREPTCSILRTAEELVGRFYGPFGGPGAIFLSSEEDTADSPSLWLSVLFLLFFSHSLQMWLPMCYAAAPPNARTIHYHMPRELRQRVLGI